MARIVVYWHIVKTTNCQGDVVSLCATVIVHANGEGEYLRKGARTLRRKLAEADMESLRTTAGALDIRSLTGDDRAIGPSITIELPAATRTFLAKQLPAEVLPLLKTIDRIAGRAFGRATIRPPRGRISVPPMPPPP